MIPILSTFEKLPVSRQNMILDAAAGVFAEAGYHGANIAEICQRADISNGALYKYFRNKEALFLGVLDRGVKLMVEEFYEKYAADAPSVYEAVVNLLQGIHQFTDRYRPYVCIYTNFSSSVMNRFASTVSQRVEQEARSFFVRLVEKGARQGEVNPRIKSEVAAYLIDSYITLYTYALVSEYHRQRFDAFFGKSGEPISEDDRINLVMEAIKLILIA